MRALVACAVSVALLGGCAIRPDLPPAPATPETLAAPYLTPEYRIQVGDQLSVRILLNRELDEDVTVRPDGRISTTIVQDEMAANRTVPQLIEVLTKGYRRFLNKPYLSVVVKSAAPIRVFVGGEVPTPGEQLIPVGTAPTLAQAIARAGGLKLAADETKVFLVRRGADDKPQFLSVRYDDILRGNDPAADIRLAPFDVVMVPKLGIAEVYRWYNQYIQQFANPNFTFNYVINQATAGSTILDQTR